MSSITGCISQTWYKGTSNSGLREGVLDEDRLQHTSASHLCLRKGMKVMARPAHQHKPLAPEKGSGHWDWIWISNFEQPSPQEKDKEDKQTPYPALQTNKMTLLSSVLFLVAVLLPSFPANGMVPNFASLSTTLNEIQAEIVNKHNSLRKTVSPTAQNMLKMVWDKYASLNAQKWAEMCQYEHSPQELRTTNTTCGENLYMSSDPNSWSDAIQSWYDEVSDFTYGIGAKSLDAVIGHYTQVVWDTSYRVGCGLAHCSNEDLPFFYVCQYCPAGNYETRVSTPYKKGITCASCPNDCEDGLCTNSCGYGDKYNNCPDLKAQVTCEHELVKNSCKATCLCEGKIY